MHHPKKYKNGQTTKYTNVHAPDLELIINFLFAFSCQDFYRLVRINLQGVVVNYCYLFVMCEIIKK